MTEEELHHERSPIRSIEQRNNARRSFDTLGRDVARLRTEGSSRPREVETLRDLAQAIGTVQNRLC